MSVSLKTAPVPPARLSEGSLPCKGLDIFFPKPWEQTSVAALPSAEERKALQVCAQCPVREWCLAQDLAECTATSQILGVRGGLRQSERRALFLELNGRRPRNGAER